MLTYYIQPQDRIPKEELLLGDTTITLTDCNGNQRIGSGLTANDLIMIKEDSTTKSLKSYIDDQYNELREQLEGVDYTVEDLQGKYIEAHGNQ